MRRSLQHRQPRFSKQRPLQFECLALHRSGAEFTVAAGSGNTVFIYRLGASK